MEHYGDITKISGYEVPIVDIITGGSPCQDLSIAGKRAGLDGERSGLFMEQIRIVKEMREHDRANKGADVDFRLLRPRFMVWENVPGAFSSNGGEDFRVVLEEIAKVVEGDARIPRFEGRWTHAGCIMGNGWSIAWRVHDAQFWGVPQRRKRIALVADFGGETAPKILFECQGLPGDIEESGKKEQEASEDVRDSTIKAISFLERAGCDGGVKESLSKTKEQQPCPPSTTSQCSDSYKGAISIGNGQLHDAMSPSKEISKTLNCMEDPAKIVVYGIDRAAFNQGQNALFGFSVEEELAQTIVSKGPGGGCNETVGALCARDYKGVGNQYVNEGKIIIQTMCSDREPSGS